MNIKKNLIILSLVMLAHGAWAQTAGLFFTRNGHVDFYSSTRLEDIKAVNDKVTSIINTATGDIEFSMLNNAFQFEKALMQEHFNENYMESVKYPKSTFKGKISNLSGVNFTTDGTYPAEVKGDLTIHGVTKNITAKGVVTVKSGVFSIESVLQVNPEDYKIDIPGLVTEKISRDIRVTVKCAYELFKK